MIPVARCVRILFFWKRASQRVITVYQERPGYGEGGRGGLSEVVSSPAKERMEISSVGRVRWYQQQGVKRKPRGVDSGS